MATKTKAKPKEKFLATADDGSSMSAEDVLTKLRAARDTLRTMARVEDRAIDVAIWEADTNITQAINDVRRIIKEGK